MDISIHAPPRGATAITRWSSTSRDYFNSRPSARGDSHDGRESCRAEYFNSRPSARGDVQQCEIDPIVQFQFTPLREGRRSTPISRRNIANFNSRPSARGDDGTSVTPDVANISIHAPPRGATPFDSHPRPRAEFQFPHLREGPSKKIAKKCEKGIISIHAPPRGATPTVCISETCTIFQFTPLREGRRGIRRIISAACTISIHAPPRGATRLCHVIRAGRCISIHAPPRGATRRTSRTTGYKNFNSRPSARGDIT